ncbi:MAG: hypothetical protein RI894_45 [Bacteroidota bacterium]|jgi:hypothetical protein
MADCRSMLCCVLFSIAHFGVFAQNEITFEASIDQQKVALNDFLEVTFTLRNAQPESFTPPPFNEFKIAGGPNQSTEMNIVNGSVSRVIAYSFYLSPKSMGKFTIGAAKIQYRGRSLQTKSMTVEVVKANTQTGRNARPGRNAPPPAAAIPSIPNFSSAAKPSSKGQKKQELTEAQLAKGIFLRAEPSKKEAFIGEEITVEYKLYTKFGLNGKQFTALPQLKGFFPVEFKQFDSNTHRESVGGTTYAVQTLRKVALYPQKTGELLLDPLGVQVGVITDNPEDAFDDPFGFLGAQMVRPYETESSPVKLKVYSLPQDAPKSFKGAVGSFTFSSKVRKGTLPTTTDEPLHLELTITGTGDFKRVGFPSLGIDSTAFEVFDPTITDNTEETPNDIQGQKHFEFILQPQKVGKLQVAPSFTYFDTPTRRYKTLTSDAIQLDIALGNKPLAAPQKDSLAVTNHSPKGALAANKTEVSFMPSSSPLLGSRWFWFLFFMPFMIIAAGGVYKRILYKQGNFSLAVLRRKKANAVAQDRLAQARSLLSQNKITDFYNEMQKALWGFVRDKFELSTAQLSKEYLHQNLPPKGVSAEQIQTFINLLNTCEMATFAGFMGNADSHAQILTKASTLINELNK